MHPVFANIFATQSAAAIATSKAMRQTEVDEYIAMLDAHDWDYEHSDDYQAYRRGKAEREKLRALADKVDPTREAWRVYSKTAW